jgi:hypothetical protein
MILRRALPVVAATLALLAALAFAALPAASETPARQIEALVFEPVNAGTGVRGGDARPMGVASGTTSQGRPGGTHTARVAPALPPSSLTTPERKPTSSPSLRRIAAVRVPTATVTAVQRGTASTYGPAFGSDWLAVPQGPGVRVRVCGAARCIERVSTDAGPDLSQQRAGRIVDLSVRDFELVTGLDWTRGLAPVTVEVLAP